MSGGGVVVLVVLVVLVCIAWYRKGGGSGCVPTVTKTGPVAADPRASISDTSMTSENGAGVKLAGMATRQQGTDTNTGRCSDPTTIVPATPRQAPAKTRGKICPPMNPKPREIPRQNT